MPDFSKSTIGTVTETDSIVYIIIIASYVGEFSGPVPFQVPFPLPDLANIAGGITLFQKVMSNCSKIVRPGPDIPVMIGV